MMHDMYPNDEYQDHSYAAWGRVMFTIDGIVVYQALEGDRVGQHRFRVCRCPLQSLLASMQPHSVKPWKSRARAPRQTVMRIVGGWVGACMTGGSFFINVKSILNIVMKTA
jgi:hypothetical protein